jgi:hypothetical protein
VALIPILILATRAAKFNFFLVRTYVRGELQTGREERLGEAKRELCLKRKEIDMVSTLSEQTFVITREWLEKFSFDNGRDGGRSWHPDQRRALRLPRYGLSGWVDALVGVEISVEQQVLFERVYFHHVETRSIEKLLRTINRELGQLMLDIEKAS